MKLGLRHLLTPAALCFATAASISFSGRSAPTTIEMVGGLAGCAQGVTPSSAGAKLWTDIKAGLAAGDNEAQLEAIVAADLIADVNPNVPAVLDGLLDAIEAAGEIAGLLGDNQANEHTVHAAVKLKLATPAK